MSKIAENKALKAYPKSTEEPYSTGFITKETFNVSKRTGYVKGYDQAMKDIQEQAEKSVIEKSNGEVTIEDLVAYNQGFKTGRELAMQDFLEKAEKILTERMYFSDDEAKEFRNYMQNEM